MKKQFATFCGIVIPTEELFMALKREPLFHSKYHFPEPKEENFFFPYPDLGDVEPWDDEELYQCPYERACKCAMELPCKGCETWAQYHRGVNNGSF